MPRKKSCLPAVPGGKPPRKRTVRIPLKVRAVSHTHARRGSANSSEWRGHTADPGFADLWTTSEIWPPAPALAPADLSVLTIRRQIEELLEEKYLREAIDDVFKD